MNQIPIAPGEGVRFELDEENQVVKINATGDEVYSKGLQYTEIEAGMFYAVSGIGTCADTDIVIPRKYNGKLVKAISDSAFSYKSSIKSIKIPDTVTSIGDFAFTYCTVLDNIEIPDSVVSIGSSAFYGCSVLKEINIPKYITNLSAQVFYGCAGFLSVKVPEAVTTI
jgi:hypothetical protein